MKYNIMNIKIGDKVKIIKNTCYHGFSTGSIVKVEDLAFIGSNIIISGRWGIVPSDYVKISDSLNKNIIVL